VRSRRVGRRQRGGADVEWVGRWVEEEGCGGEGGWGCREGGEREAERWVGRRMERKRLRWGEGWVIRGKATDESEGDRGLARGEEWGRHRGYGNLGCGEGGWGAWGKTGEGATEGWRIH